MLVVSKFYSIKEVFYFKFFNKGTHITCGIVDYVHSQLIESSITRVKCNSNDTAYSILETWKECIIKCIQNRKIDAIGIAMPGPFIYEKGISLMRGLGKFDSLYGVNIQQYLSGELGIPEDNIKFLNDASSFALGEYHFGSARGYKKGIYLTVGTGFGSTFLDDGNVISSGENVPKFGWLYHVPYEDGIAEEYFSTKWILNRYYELTGEKLSEVKDITENKMLETILNEFVENLSNFMYHWIQKFEASCLIIGGSIVCFKGHLIIPLLKKSLRNIGLDIEVKSAELFENGAIIGASAIFKEKEIKNNLFRLTNQPLLPVIKKETNSYKYDMYPVFDCGERKINVGYDSLVDQIFDKKRIIIEGYTGVNFDHVRIEIDKRLRMKGKTAVWFESISLLKSEDEFEIIVEPYLGSDDPLFGKKCNLDIRSFFDQDALKNLKYDDKFDLNIVIGIGSSLIGWDAPIIYFDLPKNEIQYRSRAKSISNFGVKNANKLSSKQAYKRFYFVDWPVLNYFKNEIKNHISIFADDQHYKNPVWMQYDDVRESLKKLAESIIRVRPWFEPGVWGGNWMKHNIPLINQDTVNYAWSFEIIAPENGVILSSNDYMLEVPFDLFMYHAHGLIMGKEAAERFDYEFPIRFDFLDTFDGDNLSIQCHPGKKYMEKNFNEKLAQDETYYILDTKEEAKVYLGFQSDIKPEQFRTEVEKSFECSKKLDILKYVKSHVCKKHDFFLIPHGTIHGSGKNNLVLEISSTPYIFTFKIYDWLRADLDGKPRTLNIKRAFDNLDFSKKGNLIENELIHTADNLLSIIESGHDWTIYHLKTHETHFYDVHRIELLTEIKLETNDQFHILMLVEGDFIQVETENKYNQRLHFGETFVIPAAAKSYFIRNGTNRLCKLVKAFIKQ
jgi:predicted NBD/HSP70 family sugar kinase/mannose-6-phosphate isomerase class I